MRPHGNTTVSMTHNLDASALGVFAGLAFTAAIGVGLVEIGSGYWRHARTTRDGVMTTGTIEHLGYTGWYPVGNFFAIVSFSDGAGNLRTAHLALPRLTWRYLREGRPMRILYSAADPQSITVGGFRMRVLLETVGVILVVLGALIAITMAWAIAGGLLGWDGYPSLETPGRMHDIDPPSPLPQDWVR